MHDVVRDVAIFIGSKEKDGFLMNSLEAFSMDSSSKDSSHNCNWMSIDISTENAKLPVGSDHFPNLRFMMIRDSTFNYMEIMWGGVPDIIVDGNNVICFEGMQGLKVLSISNVCFRSIPSTMELLKELRTLRLENCFVKDISVFGELACLEVLCIRRCHDIEELPIDIGRLNFLRLLELDDCSRLGRIAAGIISSLVRLEELKIIHCFAKWEAKGNQSEERNAGLSELESLPNLTSLEIEISDWDLLAEEICLSHKLVRYRIHSGPLILSEKYEREIGLILGDITVGNWIRQLARSTQSLVLKGEIFPVKPIKLAELEEIIYGTIPEVSNFIQNLESIRIEYLLKLAHLWNSQNQNVLLGNLKSIYISRCANLCYLFSVATTRSLVQLERLEIKDCDKIEQVFWNGMESNTDASIIEFPNLQELTLSTLPNLTAFSQGVEIIESLHQLTRLTIQDCPKLRTKIGKYPNLRFVNFTNFSGPQKIPCSRHTIQELVISDYESIEEILWNEINDEGEGHIIFPELMELELRNLLCLTTFCRGVESIEFPKLEKMTIENLPRLNSLLPLNISLAKIKSISIEGCPNLCYLFSVATASSLVQLQRLEIKDCDKIEQVLWNEMESNTDSSINVFPNLQKLMLSNLPNLADFSQGVEIIESLHQLKRLTIQDCPKLRIKIGKCPKLRSVKFTNFSGPHHLPFPRRMIKGLVIRDCESIEEILWDEIKDEGERHIIFPELKYLDLRNLPCFTTFCRGVESIEFPKLEEMTIDNLPRLNGLLPLDLEVTHDHHSPYFFCNAKNVSLGNLRSIFIEGCPNLCSLFSVATARSFVQLERLTIAFCPKIEQVLWNGMESNRDASIIEFPNLRWLTLFNLPNLAAFSQVVEIIESLHQLTRLTIQDCPKFRTKIGKYPNVRFVNFTNFSGPHYLLCSRHMIERLVINDCDTIEEILWDEIKDEGEGHIIFPKLKNLDLRNLPCFTTFCRGVESIEFPNLYRMMIGNLPRLNSLLPLDLDATHDHHSLHYFCNPKVEFPRLEELHFFELHDTISKIWCRHVPINFFHKLEMLYIDNVNDIGNLVSSSIAENLVNLNFLSIKRCQDMVDVIEDEKEAFATTLFRNLKELSIERLHKLRSFCQWNHALELPSLKVVKIVDCPGMETFTLGSLSTPYLSRISIDDTEVETKDLNGSIRYQFGIKIEDEDENKDEDDEHENSSEDKKEAEDEEKVESS